MAKEIIIEDEPINVSPNGLPPGFDFDASGNPVPVVEIPDDNGHDFGSISKDGLPFGFEAEDIGEEIIIEDTPVPGTGQGMIREGEHGHLYVGDTQILMQLGGDSAYTDPKARTMENLSTALGDNPMGNAMAGLAGKAEAAYGNGTQKEAAEAAIAKLDGVDPKAFAEMMNEAAVQMESGYADPTHPAYTMMVGVNSLAKESPGLAMSATSQFGEYAKETIGKAYPEGSAEYDKAMESMQALTAGMTEQVYDVGLARGSELSASDRMALNSLEVPGVNVKFSDYASGMDVRTGSMKSDDMSMYAEAGLDDPMSDGLMSHDAKEKPVSEMVGTSLKDVPMRKMDPVTASHVYLDAGSVKPEQASHESRVAAAEALQSKLVAGPDTPKSAGMDFSV